ncbi:MAG: hypothetical protein JO061_06270, partial [Acidobacteriaceae bacterium]|nr:hypothetical protein [Acidobacteriaceae bacterium]
SGQVVGGDLDPLAARVDGEAVILSRIPLTRQTRTDLAVTGATTQVAVYNHSLEWPHYRQLFSLLDSGPAANPGFGQRSGPGFFAGNLQSLGDSLSRLNRISITTADQGTKISELAEYRVPVSRQ